MMSLIGALIGFLGAVVPDALKLWQDHADRQHELAILDRQLEAQRQGHLQRLEAIGMEADISESKALYRTWKSGVEWVDALNGTVRPVLAYAFFLLYAGVKLMQVVVLEGALSHVLPIIWTDEDQIIFAGIISFYFGQRAMHKLRIGK